MSAASAHRRRKVSRVPRAPGRTPHSNYERYIQSAAWKATRKRKLGQVGRCQDCGTEDRLEVHHLTYDRLEHERLEDLQVLCHFCHMAEHGRPAHGVGLVAGPTTTQMSHEIKLREMRETQQGHIAIAVSIGEQAAAIAAAFVPIKNAGGLSKRTYKRSRLIEKELGKLIDEVIATPVAKP